MNATFDRVYEFLVWLSRATGLSYNEVNVIAYYIILPLVFLHLLDRIIKRHILTPCFVALVAASLVTIRDFTIFADRLFARSVDFLMGFEIVGWNYTVASVVICVLAPLAVLIVLFYFAYPSVLRHRCEAVFRISAPRYKR
ncbi:hypothetical protein ACXR0O_01120 [Verrucomicrobiota bacterium sgz303538]